MNTTPPRVAVVIPYHCNVGTVAPWIAFLDADDAWLPSKLERQLDAVEKHPEIAVHHTGLTTMYTDG